MTATPGTKSSKLERTTDGLKGDRRSSPLVALTVVVAAAAAALPRPAPSRPHLSKGFASSTPQWLSTSGSPPSSRARSCAAWHRKHALPITCSSSALRPAGTPLHPPTISAARVASPSRPGGGIPGRATAAAAVTGALLLPGVAGLGLGSAAPPQPRRSRRQRGTSLVSGCAAVGRVGGGGVGGIESHAPRTPRGVRGCVAACRTSSPLPARSAARVLRTADLASSRMLRRTRSVSASTTPRPALSSSLDSADDAGGGEDGGAVCPGAFAAVADAAAAKVVLVRWSRLWLRGIAARSPMSHDKRASQASRCWRVGRSPPVTTSSPVSPSREGKGAAYVSSSQKKDVEGWGYLGRSDKITTANKEMQGQNPRRKHEVTKTAPLGLRPLLLWRAAV